MRHLKAFRAVLAAGLLFIIAGCSSSPSQSDGKQAIENRIKEESQGRIKLTKFQKSNGAQGELMGFKIYALEFEAEIEFTENCKWVTGFQGSQLSFRTAKAVAEPQSGFSWNKFLENTQSPGELVAQGQKIGVSGIVRFAKKENGWAAENIELKNAKPIGGVIPFVDPRASLSAEEKAELTKWKKDDKNAAPTAKPPNDPVASARCMSRV